MAAILETVNRFRKIEEATAPKDDPAPVYLLDEIADMTRQSPEAAQAIADAVQKKLGVKSPIVKFKALRIIKHLCTKGCSQFQRCMQRHSAAVRELIHWRGEPDPFKGDVPNARVREFAKEVVEVLFNSTPVTNSTNTLAAQGKIQGFGSGGETSTSTYSGIGSSGIASSGSGRFGSASSSSASMTWPHGLTGLVAAQQAASQITRSAQNALGEGPIAQGIANAANAIGGLLQPQGYGSRLNDSPYKDSGHSNGNADYGYASGGSYAAPTVSANQVLGSEEGLVDDITAPGGLRPLPDAADLRRFVDTISSMDGLRVAELLRAKMEFPRWQIVLKSLAALEAILQRGSTQACGEVAVMFQSDPDPVRKCLQSQQQQVQQLAAAVLKLLLGEDVAVPAAAAAAAGFKKGAVVGKSAAAAPVADLLVDDDDGPAPAAAEAAPAGGGVDLLADLMGPAAAAAGSSTSNASLDGLGVAPTPPAAAAAGADDLFGGLNIEDAPAAAAPAESHITPSTAPAAAAARTHAAATLAPAAAAAGSKATNAPLDELFAGISTSNTSNLLGIGSSPVQQQQQQPFSMGLPQQQQQHQQQPLGLQQQQQQQGFAGQPDLLGGFSSPVKQPGFGMQGNLQQQQYGIPGLGNPQQQQWGVPPHIAGLGRVGSGNSTGPTNVSQHQHLLRERSGSGSGAAAGWKSHTTASEAAFDFVFDEFKKH